MSSGFPLMVQCDSMDGGSSFCVFGSRSRSWYSVLSRTDGSDLFLLLPPAPPMPEGEAEGAGKVQCCDVFR